jgi:transposase
VRQIDSLLDLSWVHKELAPYCSHTGRPSIDPALMIRMLLVGYIFAVRSERRIGAEIQRTLPIAGSASSVSKTKYLTTPRSAVRGTNASERAMPYAGSLKM